MTNRHHPCPELPAPPGRLFLFGLIALAAGTAVAYGLRCPTHPLVAGYLAARTTHVISDREGIVAEFVVHEGDEVNLDTPLVKLSDNRLAEEIAQKQQELATLRSELQRCLAEAELEVDWRLRTLNGELCDIQLRSAGFLKERFNHELRRTMIADILHGDSVVMGDTNDSLYESIVLGSRIGHSDRVTSMLELEAVANSVEVSAAQVEICEQQIKSLTELKAKTPEHVRKSAGVDVAEMKLQQAEAELQQLQRRETLLTVSSPAIGRVGVFQLNRGDHVLPGTPIVELLDSSQRFLVVHVPSQQITGYTIGTRVRLSFPGNQIREGRVYSIAPQAEPRSQAPLTVGSDAPVTVHVEQVGEVWPDVPMGSRVIVGIRE